MSDITGPIRMAALFLCAAPALLLAARKPVTIDALMEHNRIEGFGHAIWAPDGARFVHQRSGKLFLYDVPRKTDQELLAMDELEKRAVPQPAAEQYGWQNRRVRGESVQWSPDGAGLLIAVKGDLFLWSFRTRKAEQLTATAEDEADPKLSPDGARVAFRRGHDLYALDIATKQVTRLTMDGSATLLNGEPDWVYPEELDLGTAYWWSPDGRKIAFMQFNIAHEFVYPQTVLTGLRAVYEPERYPQAGTPNATVRVGVITVGAAEPATQWLDLGGHDDDLIARVDWLRDSNRVAIQRMNRVQNRLDVLVADSATGSSRVILHEQDPYWINLSDAYKFLKGSDQFIWSSERDGHRHLWLYSTDGKEEARLTKGNGDVESIAGVDEQRQLLWYLTTGPGEYGPLLNQLWRVGFDGSSALFLAGHVGSRQINMSPGAHYYVQTVSDWNTPPRTTVHDPDGRELAVLSESDRSASEKYELLRREIVQVKAEDGTILYGSLIRPKGFKKGRRYPVIVSVYGGPGVQTIRDVWRGPDWDQVMAQRGFVIWSLDNRGSTGRGHAFETPIYHRFGKTELADQLTGVRWLIAQGIADPHRIGITGWSYGGYMTLYSLLNAPDTFRAGIAGAPVTNWHNYDTIYTERYLGLTSEDEAGYAASSDVTYADKLRSALLIVHNIEDDNVLFQNTVQMSDALEKADRKFSLIFYTEKTHGLTGPVRRHLYETMTEFFERELSR